MSGLKAVILDWAGTVLDHGSRAPMGAFVEVFRQFGVDITVAEARGPMGMAKWDHIRALGDVPRIAAAWQARHGRAFSDADADAIHDVFVPLNARVVTDYATLIPGAAEAVATLRARGLKIGSTTGYTRQIMAPLLPVAAAQGYAPDNLVCAGDLPRGRPSAMMMYRCFLELEVGVALTGNECGLSLEELQACTPEQVAAHRARAAWALRSAGAHEVVDGIADLPEVVARIAARVARGERP
ncbi:MAG: phosphonoacetaldehyde hydrolase [Alphaproteobacteria bacterium]|nr:phosphonoacetaldehyde hydrolase [Alphaproteobacteria bacterium]